MGITLADIVIAALLVLALIYGWRRGTINVIAQVGSLVLAYQAARLFSAKIAAYLVTLLPSLASSGKGSGFLQGFLSLFIDTTGMANRLLEIVLYIAIFVVVNWLVRKVAHMLTGVFGHGLLGKLNRAIGAFVALLLMLAIILILVDIILPACVKMGFGGSLLAFFRSSALLLPLLSVFSGSL